jgi:hypothetical protein
MDASAFEKFLLLLVELSTSATAIVKADDSH